jgi:hypothetical protein
MKYCDTKGSGLTKEQLQKMEEMAKDTSIEIRQRGGLDVRNWDREDFPEISICSIVRMIERAYKMGLEDGRKGV